MNVQTFFGSKLAAAESDYNSAFDVIGKIQKTAENAEDAAAGEAAKAGIKMIAAQTKMRIMEAKQEFYGKRAKKIANFIESIGD